MEMRANIHGHIRVGVMIAMHLGVLLVIGITPPTRYGCEFAKLLKENARDLIGLSLGSQRAVQEFIDYHHNPIVAVANQTIGFQQSKIRLLEEELKEASEFIQVLKDVMGGYQKVMGLKEP